MSWSGGSYSKGNAATGGWTGDASLGIGIEAARHDTQDNDFANGINQCLNKDGSNSCTGDLNLGGFKPVNLAAGTAAAPALCVANDTNTGIFEPAADTWAVSTNGTEKLRVDSTGKVGIGTTSPSASLDIQATTATSLTTQFSADVVGPIHNLQKSRGATVGTNTIVQNGDILGVLRFNGANGSGYTEGAYVAAFVDGTPGASNDMPTRLVFATSNDGAGISTERMRITSNGNVGIGTTSPSLLLDVQGSSNAALGERIYNSNNGASANARLQIGNDVSSQACVIQLNSSANTAEFAGPSSLNLVQGLSAPLAFYTNGTERIRITNTGSVGIGTTTPSYQLTLSTDSAAKPTTNTWTIVSDARIKTNVRPYIKGLAEIKKVAPVEYDYNGKGGMMAGPGGISIIAQDLQPVFPECIGSYQGKLDPEDEENTTILNYNGHAMTFALINAVKELNAKMESLEARIAQLES